MRPNLLVICSALSGVLPFLWPTAFWWLIFFFMIPLFYRIAYNMPGHPWREGLLWGVCFFTCHSAWLVWLMSSKSGFPLGSFLFSLLLIGYLVVHSSCWFGMAVLLARRYNYAWFRVLIFAIVSLIFWVWLERGILCISGQFDGHPLLLPLLPLVAKPTVLSLLPLLGTIGLLGVLIGWSSNCALLLYARQWRYFVGVLCCMIPFCIGFIVNKIPQAPHWQEHIGYIAPVEICDLEERVQEIAARLTAYRQTHPAVSLIVMPESTLPTALNNNHRVATLWDTALLHENIPIIIGSHKFIDNCWYNTLYVLCRGEIVAMHEKKHLMPLIEYMPSPWSRIAWLSASFLRGCYPFSHAKGTSSCLTLNNGHSFMPYICSELFFAQKAPSGADYIPIIFLCNDSWFLPYIRQLLIFCARYKAIAWQRALLYVGHYGAHWIMSDGNIVEVK